MFFHVVEAHKTLSDPLFVAKWLCRDETVGTRPRDGGAGSRSSVVSAGGVAVAGRFSGVSRGS